MQCYKKNRCKRASNCPRNYETFEGFCRDFERGRYNVYNDKKDKYEGSKSTAPQSWCYVEVENENKTN